MPTYDSQHFDPPAPVANVTLRHPDIGTAVSDIPMLLDTGADATIIPRSVVEDLGVTLISGKVYELQAFDGRAAYAGVARVELVLLGLTFRGQFLVLDTELGIIGRNVLNALRVSLDGPGLVWEIEHPT